MASPFELPGYLAKEVLKPSIVDSVLVDRHPPNTARGEVVKAVEEVEARVLSHSLDHTGPIVRTFLAGTVLTRSWAPSGHAVVPGTRAWL